MRWIEATIQTKTDEIDALCLQIEDLGIQGVSIEDENDLKQFLETNKQYWDYIDESLTKRFEGVSRIKFYLIDDADGRANLNRIQEKLQKEIQISYVDDENWEYTWRQNFQPIEIGDRLEIVPEWIEADSQKKGRIPLRLEPGLAFGTGTHATTRLCLKILDGLDLRQKRVLDLGCGSGILGIASLLLGAAECKACDVDSNARTATTQNAKLNQIETLPVYIGNILSDEKLRQRLGTGYDLVVANIVADVIKPLTGYVSQFMKEDGYFLCSGIIADRAQEIEETLKSNNFEIQKHLQEENWNCYLSKKKESSR